MYPVQFVGEQLLAELRIHKGGGLQTTKQANIRKSRHEGDGKENQPPVKMKRAKSNNGNKSAPASSEDFNLSKYFDGLPDSKDNNTKLTE